LLAALFLFLVGLRAAIAQDAVVAMDLGPAASHEPITESDWLEGTTLSQFLPANGLNSRVTPATVSIVWDTKAIYVRFRCEDPDPIYRNGERLRRSDRVEVAVVPPGGHQQDLRQYSVDEDGAASESYKGEKTDVHDATVSVGVANWTAEITIPWSQIGGVPTKPFLMQLSRVRGITGEVLSPSAVDFHDGPINTERGPAAIDEFIEVSLGGASRAYSAGAGLITLPSGVRRWERRSILNHIGVEERKQIAALQEKLASQPTSEANLKDRVRLAEIWYDLLDMEGFSFHYDSGAWILAPGDLDPWTARHEFNDRLAAGDIAGACRILDALLQHFDRVTKVWFADGTPGDVRDEGWASLRSILSVSQLGDELILHGRTEHGAIDLSVSFPAIGGMRLHGPRKGVFSPPTLSKLQLTRDTDGVTASARDLTVKVTTGDTWRISLERSEHSGSFWSVGRGDLRIYLNPSGEAKGIEIAGPLKPEEEIFGLGERFDSINQRGKTLTLWELDAWDSTAMGGLSNQAYKPIPLWHSTTGYSAFWNTSYEIRADFGTDRQDRYRIVAHGPVLDLYIWPGDYTATVQEYTELTGRPLLPPVWSFEPWMGGGGGRWSEERWQSPVETMLDVVARFTNLDIPHSSIYAEGPGSSESKLYRELEPRGIHVLTWGRSQATDWSMEQIQTALPNVVEAQLPLMRLTNGDLYTFPQSNLLHYQFPYIDFTNPTAIDLVRAYWKRRLDLGVAGTMVDFADLVPRDALFSDGTSGEEMHNAYVRAYDHTIHQVFGEWRDTDFILFARGAAPGTQVDAGQMAGDHASNFRGLDESLNGGLSLSVSGFSNWGSDVGGYWGKPDEEVYLRWIEFGAFSPLMRFHGTEPREPWYYSDAAVTVYRKYAWLRENLLPYVYGTAQDAHTVGVAIMRPLISVAKDEYMFGDDLLVAPVHTPGDRRPIAFPRGDWTDFWTGEPVTAEKLDAAVPLDEIPVFLRSGAIVPVELAPSFKFGESMTNGRVPVLIVTPPAAVANHHKWNLPVSEEAINIESATDADGFKVKVNGWHELHYLMIVGLRHQIKSITVNSQTLSRLSSADIDGLPPGWIQLDQTRILVRIPTSSRCIVHFTTE
jgi:alpha-glucosidase (family GH31 glycosyl hydrolase)